MAGLIRHFVLLLLLTVVSDKCRGQGIARIASRVIGSLRDFNSSVDFGISSTPFPYKEGYGDADDDESKTHVVWVDGDGRPIDADLTRQLEHQQEEEDEPLHRPTLNGSDLVLPRRTKFLKLAQAALEDSLCREHFALIYAALERREQWALKMYDASAKSADGILAGSLYHFGNFDECLDVKLSASTVHVLPKYCLAKISTRFWRDEDTITKNRAKLNSTERGTFHDAIHWGICVPSTCPEADVERFIKSLITHTYEDIGDIKVKVPRDACHVDYDEPYTKLDLVYVGIVASFCIIILMATLYHIVFAYRQNHLEEQKESTLRDFIMAFSVIRSVKKIMSVKEPNSLSLDCICGIKFFSMCFIVAGHSLVFLSSGPALNDRFFKDMTKQVINGFFLSNALLVDTFLLISGFLMCRLLLLELEKRKGQINFLVLYIVRYIRLTPSYLVMIGLYCTWLIRLGKGPLWDERIGLEMRRCTTSYWANLLYINNYASTDDICMFQSWYLSVDTQLFMLAPLIIYPLYKNRKFGEWLLGITTVIATLIPFVATYFLNLDPTLMTYAPEINDLSANWYFKNVYMKTHMRASSYFIGLIFGYLVHRIQEKKYKLPQWLLIVGWSTAVLCSTAAMFSVVSFYLPEYEYTALKASLYSSLHRVAWCLGTGWLIIACITDNGGPLKRLLSWKPLVPLSRLTYCAYLVNGAVELYDYGSTRQPNHMGIYSFFAKSMSNVSFTFTAAFVLCVLFESPIHSFEKILLRKESKRRREVESERV